MNTARKIVKKTIDKFNDDERKLTLVWAQGVNNIRKNAKLTKKQKLKAIKELENLPVIRSFFKGLYLTSKAYLWDERSWSARCALIGLSAGAAVAGGKGAGIAALGGAIGIPLFLLTSAGGALLGMIIQELSAKQGERKKQ